VGSDGFTVDLGALSAAHDRVGRLTAELVQPPRDAPGAEVFGHDRLHNAVSEFAVQEKRGLAMLASEAESTRHGLAETIKTYRKTEEAAADRFRDIQP
jgi:hypothetical protein